MRKSNRLAVAAKVFAVVCVFSAVMAGFNNIGVAWIIFTILSGAVAYKCLFTPMVGERAKTK